jgi:3-oxoacyl-[acyl-carrier protein] reductase
MTQKAVKSAIVTGASRGIGAAIAERLAKDGFAVVVNYASGSAAASELVRKIEQSGGRAIAVQADVSNGPAVQSMFEATEAAFGGVDVLVNNAGIMTLSSIGETTDAAFARMVDINFKGTFNTMREAARRLRKGGRIINISTSIVGTKLETYAVYAATKAAVETMTAILAKEMRGREITVNAVAPGPTATDLFFAGKSQEVVDRMAKLSPLERIGAPKDIAGVVSFLAGPDGGWVNGQTLRANGGLV